MQRFRVLAFTLLTGFLALGCAKGKDAKSVGKEDKLAFDESGTGRKCENPKSTCEEVKDQSLDFKEKCREAGFRMKQCGCDNLCSGNINGDRTGYSSKNQMKTCKDSGEKCETQETSAAYQDACDMVGGEMMECGCEWLCSKKLKEAIPDAPKEEEQKADEAGGGDDKKKDDKAAKEEKARGNMDGRSADEIAKDKAAKEKAAKDKSEKDKEKSNDSSSGGKKKKTGRFSDPE